MTSPKSAGEIIVSETGRGWVAVTRESWDYINTQLDAIAAIASCSIWAEYIALDVDDFDELVREILGVEPDEQPADDMPFSVDLSDLEDHDRSGWLERAMTDLLESFEDDDFLWDKVVNSDIWTYIEDDHRDNVIQALRERGFTVTLDES